MLNNSHIKVFPLLFCLIFLLLFDNMKFSFIGPSHLASSLEEMRDEQSSAKYSFQFLRPSVRGLLLSVSVGGRIPPEFVRVVISGCLKVAGLRTVVFTIPSKEKGLRIQTSDIILGEPGVGKGQAFQ